ncbi:MAG: LysM peptidoglycan-binding domain-containing protein [Oxalobacter sp.]|nr:MAG: LysM peptidoglycan-binding domain-containing protein [Oxalobacter sp.]
MKNFRCLLLSVCISLLAACTSMQKPAPILDRTSGVRPAAMYEGKPGYYVVKQGDTVMQVSRITGQNPADIIAWNNLSHPNSVSVGQVLRVAPPGAEGAPMIGQGMPVESQTGGVASRSVEMTPLVSGGSAASATAFENKTVPRGEKLPYSDSVLAEMQHNPDYAPQLASADKAAMKTEVQKPVTSMWSGGTQTGATVKTWAWPSEGRMVSVFSDNYSKGIDIAGRMGQPVTAAADGKVTHVGPLRGYGNMVIIKHSDNLNSVYAHNKTILVKEGDTVRQGQQIAEMGNSDSDMVKLRFEIRQHGKPVDPTRYLPPR